MPKPDLTEFLAPAERHRIARYRLASWQCCRTPAT